MQFKQQIIQGQSPTEQDFENAIKTWEREHQNTPIHDYLGLTEQEYLYLAVIAPTYEEGIQALANTL